MVYKANSLRGKFPGIRYPVQVSFLAVIYFVFQMLTLLLKYLFIAILLIEATKEFHWACCDSN